MVGTATEEEAIDIITSRISERLSDVYRNNEGIDIIKSVSPYCRILLYVNDNGQEPLMRISGNNEISVYSPFSERQDIEDALFSGLRASGYRVLHSPRMSSPITKTYLVAPI